MPRLNQLIAIEVGVKDDAARAYTGAKRVLAADPAAFDGRTRTYRPRTVDEVGTGVRIEDRPDQSVKVQINAEDVLTDLARSLQRLFDVTLSKEDADTHARADVVVRWAGESTTLLADVPVTYLLFLEKQVNKIKDVVGALPLLNPALDWDEDGNTGLWRTPVDVTASSKKIPRNHVRFAGDEHHEPQVDVWQEDVIVGDWHQVIFSGAVSAKRKKALFDRLDALLRAVISAREEANSIGVQDREAGKTVLAWILGREV